jgi:hypothetical protein
MNPTRHILLFLAVGLLAGSTGLADDGSTELAVLKARIDFGRRAADDSLLLKARFDPSLLSRSPAPEEGVVRVTIGPETVISLPVVETRGKWKVKKSRVFRYRQEATRKSPGSILLKIKPEKGKMVLRGDGLDLDAIRAAGPEEITFTFEFDGAVYSKTLDMGARNDRFRYRFVPGSGGGGSGFPGFPPGGGGSGGGGGGGGGGLPVSFRVLGSGSFPTGISTPVTTVIRDQTTYFSEWFKRHPAPAPGMGMPVQAPPSVDFTTELVVLVDLGGRPTGGYSVTVTGAGESGNGLAVTWQETKPGTNCIVTQAITYPHVFAAVTRREGAVTFSGSVVTKNCP